MTHHERPRQATDSTSYREDLQEDRLRALFATAYPPLKRSEQLREEVGGRNRARAPQVAPAGRRWPLLARGVPLRAMAAAILLAGLSLGALHWSQRKPREPQSSLFTLRPDVRKPAVAPTATPESGAADTHSWALKKEAIKVGDRLPSPEVEGTASARGGGGGRMLASLPDAPHSSPISIDGRLSHARRLLDDQRNALIQGRAEPLRPWAGLPCNEWDEIEAQVRRRVLVRDDFVTVPFPRLVSTSDRQIAQAVESYKREAAIVDPRLTREVTLQFKATALSDLCDRLRSDTGIRLEAGRSVADEKVTLFSAKQPLREVMRQLSRPFGYTWLRSKREDGYRYELVQDLRSQLLEEELRNRDRHAALLSLEQELQRFRPYLSLSPDQILARARTAPPAEKKLLEKIGGSETRSALGWGQIQMYFRLSSQEKMALLAGETLYFSEGPRPGERPLPPDVARGVMQGWRDERALKVGGGYRMTNANDPGSIPISHVPGLRASVSVSLDQSELGQYGLNGLSGFYGDFMNRRTSSGPYAIGRSPRIVQPDNARTNARLAQDPALRSQVSIQPRHTCEGLRHEPTNDPRPMTNQGRPSDVGRSSLVLDRHVTTADVLEALHQATGLPIIADYHTCLYKPDSVSVRGQTVFAALNQLCDTMRLRWNREGGWLQFRSTSYYDDRLKEVPSRLLERWAAVRRQHGGLRLDDLVEIVGLTDAQLQGAEMAEGAKECHGLAEWDLARNGLVLGSLRYLAGFTPEQRRKAEREAGLPFTEMSLAQQQGFLAKRFPAKLVGTGTPNPATLPSLEDLSGAVLRVDYRQPGWYEWRPPGPYLLRWLVPVAPGPQVRLIPRPKVRERTREAALQALGRVDPQVRAAVLAAAGRNDPRLLAEPVSDEAQIVPTDLNLTLIYAPARQSVLVVNSDFWGVIGAW